MRFRFDLKWIFIAIALVSVYFVGRTQMRSKVSDIRERFEQEKKLVNQLAFEKGCFDIITEWNRQLLYGGTSVSVLPGQESYTSDLYLEYFVLVVGEHENDIEYLQSVLEKSHNRTTNQASFYLRSNEISGSFVSELVKTDIADPNFRYRLRIELSEQGTIKNWSHDGKSEKEGTPKQGVEH